LPFKKNKKTVLLTCGSFALLMRASQFLSGISTKESSSLIKMLKWKRKHLTTMEKWNFWCKPKKNKQHCVACRTCGSFFFHLTKKRKQKTRVHSIAKRQPFLFLTELSS
jgi:hypothetical protein